MIIENILKIVQITFYSTLVIVIILIYFKIRRGLLKEINIEYQKKTIIRIEDISDYLISEFDYKSEFCWMKQKPVEKCVEEMLQRYESIKELEKSKAEKKWIYGTVANPTTYRLYYWLMRVKYDPFLPKSIRDIVTEHVQSRIDITNKIYDDELRKLGEELLSDSGIFLNIDFHGK